MQSQWAKALLIVCFIYSLRPSTLPLPGLGLTFTQWQDRWWDSRVERPEHAAKAFDERFGSPGEKYPALLGQFVADVVSGDFVTHMSTPHLGEPLEIAAVVRRFPAIKRVSLSTQIAGQGELYQRLFEGLYPVQVQEGEGEHYRLVTASEVAPCQVLAVAKEAHLVLCP